MKKINYIISFVLIYFSILSCTEPYALQTETFEDILVVEASITNELKTQEIKLTRTYQLEQFNPLIETKAKIYVKDNLGNQYNFEEINGKYLSTVPFQAVLNSNYTLHIATADGGVYVSNNQKLTTATSIESINANVASKNGENGVQISINSKDLTNTSKYYRYTYEETAKVTVPKWNAFDAVLSPNGPFIQGIYKNITTVLRIGESKTCYTTKNSSDLILTNTLNNIEDKVTNFPVRFISDQDYTIAERYSIKIMQYVQNQESFKFYNTLLKLSSSGSLLSQFQPGLLVGNIKSQLNPNEKVIGFFEVSSVSEKRLFFNFSDIFGNQPKPSYFNECTLQEYESDDFKSFQLDGDPAEGIQLRSIIASRQQLYYNNDANIFYMVNPVCGDCRTFSSNIKPTFWID